MRLPNIQPNTSTAPPTARAIGPRASTTVQASQVSLTAVACFDLAEDGEINTRPALDGGDATLLLPSHAIDLPTWPHPALLPSAKPASIANAGPASTRPDTATHVAHGHAAAAYGRYGETTPPQDLRASHLSLPTTPAPQTARPDKQSSAWPTAAT